MQRLVLAILAVGLLVWPVAGRAQNVVVVLPVDSYFERQTVKGFGTLADDNFHEQHRALFPHNGWPNQFTGYHAAVDVEYTDPANLTRDVPVRAITDGEVVYAGDVAGYGGLIIVRHAQPETVSSLYGHIRLGDARVRVGDRVRAGQELAVLGSQFTAETSGARKHLHFGIHRGAAVYLAGHEPSVARLGDQWYNPNDWLQRYLAVASPVPTMAITPTPAPEHKNIFQRVLDWLTSLFS